MTSRENCLTEQSCCFVRDLLLKNEVADMFLWKTCQPSLKSSLLRPIIDVCTNCCVFTFVGTQNQSNFFVQGKTICAILGQKQRMLFMSCSYLVGKENLKLLKPRIVCVVVLECTLRIWKNSTMGFRMKQCDPSTLTAQAE